MKVYTIAHEKGGVGKTTLAAHLAMYLGHRFRTLIIDLDPQGQVAPMFGLPHPDNAWHLILDEDPTFTAAIPARPRHPGLALRALTGGPNTGNAQVYVAKAQIPIRHLRRVLEDHRPADFVIIDTSPSLGGIQEMAIAAADVVVIPTACDFLSALQVQGVMRTTAQLDDLIGWQGARQIVPTFYDAVTRESKQVLADLRSTYGEQVVPQVIDRCTTIREASAAGLTLFEYPRETEHARTVSRQLSDVCTYLAGVTP